MLSDSEAAELLSFLTPATRPDVKAKATEYILGLSGHRDGCRLLRSKPDVVSALVALTSDPSVAIAKDCYHILINLSADETLHQVLQEEMGLAQLVEIFCTEGFNKKAKLHYLGPLLSNLSQLPEARSFLMDKDRCVIQRLLPFTQYQPSVVRRGGVIGTLRNCCFDHSKTELPPTPPLPSKPPASRKK
ncbi:unnamed protein product [Menidia menidia]|uniref:(Atlantic silverside) hypothetical protein n=1 Tax=Menidia menidia TaxID=238744 RepID=A0A8S4BJC5_9TELE|nr:unnamed protein product [Menidia menidia]